MAGVQWGVVPSSSLLNIVCLSPPKGPHYLRLFARLQARLVMASSAIFNTGRTRAPRVRARSTLIVLLVKCTAWNSCSLPFIVNLFIDMSSFVVFYDCYIFQIIFLTVRFCHVIFATLRLVGFLCFNARCLLSFFFCSLTCKRVNFFGVLCVMHLSCPFSFVELHWRCQRTRKRLESGEPVRRRVLTWSQGAFLISYHFIIVAWKLGQNVFVESACNLFSSFTWRSKYLNLCIFTLFKDMLVWPS